MKFTTRTKAGAAGVAMVVTTPLVLAPQAYASPIDQRELTQLATRYLQNRLNQATSSADTSPPDALAATPMSAQLAAHARVEAAELTRLRRTSAGTAAEYSNATVKLTHPQISVAGGEIRMSTEEHAHLEFARPGNHAGAPSGSSYHTPHVFTFQRNSGRWTVTSDALDIPVNAPDPTFYVHPTKLKAPLNRNLSLEPKLPDTIRPNYPGAPQWSSTLIQGTASSTAVGFNRQAVVDYARRYALNYNSNYERFGNDCANFASQSLRAGGWQDAGHGEEGPGKWWQFRIRDTFPVHSASWSVSQNLDVFGYAYSHRFRSYAGEVPHIGDIVFADWENGTDGHLDHTMIVTSNPPLNIND